jgi:hypothetical protein
LSMGSEKWVLQLPRTIQDTFNNSTIIWTRRLRSLLAADILTDWVSFMTSILSGMYAFHFFDIASQ